MTKELQDELVKALKENSLFDFVANNYYLLTKEELKDILVETYDVSMHMVGIVESRKLGEEIINSLKDYTSVLEED